MAEYPNPTGINGGTATHMPSNVQPYESSADEGGSLPSPGAGGGSAPPAPGVNIADKMAALEPLQAPGSPDELLTEGASFGPGAGPEALGGLAPGAPTPDMKAFAKYVPMLEILAMQPGSSQKVRQMLRMIKAHMPPQVLQEMQNAAGKAGSGR